MGILELLLKITADSSDARADLDRLRATQGALVNNLTGSLAAGLNTTSASFQRTRTQTAETSKETERYTTRTRSAEAAQRDLSRTQAQAAREAIQLGAAQARASSQQQIAALRLGVVQARSAGQLDRIAQAQERASSRNFLSHLRQGATAAQQFGQGLSSLGRTLTFLVTAPLVAAGAGIVSAAVKMDSLKRGLIAVEGSAALAEARLKRLEQTAKLPGLAFKEAIQGQIRLEAVGFSADGATRTLEAFARAVAFTGGGGEELDRITIQLGQIAAKGKLMAMDLRPILEAAPAVATAVRAAFNTIDTEAIQKLNLTSEQLFAKLLPELEKIPTVTSGAKNAFENFNDALFRTQATIGEAVLPAITSLVETITPLIEKAAATFRSLPEGIQQAIIAFGVLLAVIGPVLFLLGSLIGSIASVVLAVISAAAAVGGFAVLGQVALVVLATLAQAFIYLLVAIGPAIAIVLVLREAWARNIGGIQQTVFSAFTAIRNFFTQVMAEIRAVVQRVLPEIRATISAFTDNVQAFWETHGKFIVAVISQAWGIITRIIITAIRLLGDVITFFLRVLRADWDGAWEVVVTIFFRAVNAIQDIGIRLSTFMASLLVYIVKLVFQWGNQLYTAAIAAGVRLMDGFTYYIQGPGLVRAVMAVLAVASAISSPTVLASFAAAGYAQARARSDAYNAVAQPDAGGGAEAPQTFQSVRLNPDGSLKTDAAPGALFKPGLGAGAGAGAGGGGGKGKGKKDRTAEEDAQGRIQLAQTLLQTAERAYQQETAAANRAYDLRAVALSAFVARAKLAEDQRLQAVLNNINLERAEVDKTEKNKIQRQAKQAELDEREAAARAEAAANRQALDDKTRQAEIDALASHQESILRQADIYDQRRIEALRSAGDLRSLSAQAVERKIIQIERAAFDRRFKALEIEKTLAGENIQAQQVVADKIAELTAEKAAFEEGVLRRGRASRQSDLDHLRAVERERRQLLEDTAAQALAVGNLELDRMERERVNSDVLARARRDQALAAIDIERTAVLRRLAEEKTEALERVKGLEDELERKKEINDLYRTRELLSEEEFQRRKKAIQDTYKQQDDEEDTLLGPLDKITGKIGDYGDAAQVLGQRIAATFDGIRNAVGESVKAWVLYGKTQGAIIRKVLAEQLAALAQEAAMEGIKQTALALAALATGNFGAAAKHGLSAAAWFGLAGGAALLGRKVAGDLFTQGGAAAGAGGGGTGGGAGTTAEAGRPERVITEQGRNVIRQEIIFRVASNDSHILNVATRDITQLNGRLRGAVVQVVEG